MSDVTGDRQVRLLVCGSLHIDLVGCAPRIPAPGETMLGGALEQHHGGKGGNQAVAAARLGASVRFIGAVGQDASGDALLAGLRHEGIDASAVAQLAGCASGAALITVAEASGENAITVLPGANRQVPLPAAGHAFGAAALLVLQHETPLATYVAWAKAARAAKVPVLLNAAPMGQSVELTPLLALTDVLVVNEGELERLVGMPGEPERQLRAASELGARTVVVTLGASGCARGTPAPHACTEPRAMWCKRSTPRVPATLSWVRWPLRWAAEPLSMRRCAWPMPPLHSPVPSPAHAAGCRAASTSQSHEKWAIKITRQDAGNEKRYDQVFSFLREQC